MQIKTILRHHFIPIKMAIIKGILIASDGEEVEKLEAYTLLVEMGNGAAASGKSPIT